MKQIISAQLGTDEENDPIKIEFGDKVAKIMSPVMALRAPSSGATSHAAEIGVQAMFLESCSNHERLFNPN
jgi:hypothetical protein